MACGVCGACVRMQTCQALVCIRDLPRSIQHTLSFEYVVARARLHPDGLQVAMNTLLVSTASRGSVLKRWEGYRTAIAGTIHVRSAQVTSGSAGRGREAIALRPCRL